MNAEIKQFSNKLTGIWPGFDIARQRHHSEFGSEYDLPTILFAGFGSRLVEDFDQMTEPIRQRVFELIESGMISEDELLSTAVATGLLEAVSGDAIHQGSWEAIRGRLGPESRSYTDQWEAWVKDRK